MVGLWAIVTLVVGLAAPNLTRLAAEGQSRLLPRGIESVQTGGWVAKAWPEYAYDSLAAIALKRDSGLTAEDHEYAKRLCAKLLSGDKPANLMRILGPGSKPEIADRLKSEDGTVELLLAQMNTSLVVPSTEKTIKLLQTEAADPVLAKPAGLEVLWTGDSVLGADYMRNVQASLDRAALATVGLLLVVLLVVYRSFLLAMIPLATIGVSLVVSRGVLGWLAASGWELSPLVELFLIAVLFGSGTDFCLFLSWRYGEHWSSYNPASAMRLTLRRAIIAILTSAGTVIVSLSVMGVNKFRLFSSTGPSVALGLLITLAASLTLTPALLVLLSKLHPRSFRGITSPPSGVWDKIAVGVLAKPKLCWTLTVVVMLPMVFLAYRTTFLQDLFAELPAGTQSLVDLKKISQKFDPGALSPLTVVIKSDRDLRDSEGLALIDDVSRYLAHQRSIVSVRSATQPLGSPETLKAARISSRIETVKDGFGEMKDGAKKLNEGLTEGASKLRALLLLEELAGLSSEGARHVVGESHSKEQPAANAKTERISPAFKHAIGNLVLGSAPSTVLSLPNRARSAAPKAVKPPKADDPRVKMLDQLTLAAEGALRIYTGAQRAQRELSLILQDKVGSRALDRLLIRADTLQQNPRILESLKAYLSPDGKLARIDATQEQRIFSTAAMSEVELLRARLNDYLADYEDMHAHAYITGANAGASDVQKLTQADQTRAWIIVPLAVFFVLLFALRDLGACINLVGTMVLTYGFALGATHLVFVTMLGADGLDWKVPYFLFVLLVAVGVDYNVFLMTRLQEEAELEGLKEGTRRAIAQTGGLITSAAAITACSFASFMLSPLSSLRQLGFALVVGIVVDAVLVRPVLVPCGHWLLNRRRPEPRRSMEQLDVEDDPVPELAGFSS